MGVGKSTFAFTKESIVLGADSTTINITSDNQLYSHRLATTKGTIATLPVGTTSYTWSPTASDLAAFIKENTHQKTFNITVTLYTYNGSTEVGLDAHYLTLTLSDADGRPSLSVATTDTLGHITKYGGLVSSQSKLGVTVTTSGKYDATVGIPSGSFVGQSYTGSPMMFVPRNDLTYVTVQNWGDLSEIKWTNLNGQAWGSVQGLSLPYKGTLVVRATDSRGFTSSYYKNYTILPYTPPTISNSDVIRCDSAGTLSLSGTYVKASIAYSITSLSAKNTKKLVIKYKSSTSSSWTSNTVTLSDYSGTKSVIMSNFTVGASYDFKMELSDDFSTDTDEMALRTSGTVLEVDASGESVVLGDIYGYNALLRPDEFEVRKGISTKLKISDGEFRYPVPNVTVDCNAVTTNSKLYNIFTSSADAVNYPIANNGWLETTVYTGDTNYRFQRYTTYNGTVYERSMTDGVWSAWGRHLRQFVLYSNYNAAVDTTATLSESAANFEEITIQFVTNADNYSSVTVMNPNGKSVMLVGGSASTTAGTMYMKYKTVLINGTKITRVNTRFGETQLTTNFYNKTDVIRVVRVIGWR